METKPTTQAEPIYGTARGSRSAYTHRGCRCPECRAANTAAAAAYLTTDRGKAAYRAARKRYEATDKGKASKRRYYATDKGKASHQATQKRYRASDRGKETERRYWASDAGRLSYRRYNATAKGMLRSDRLRTKALIQRVERLEEELT
jgi:hypothetical protein